MYLKGIEAMKESLKIQGYDGNWNYDEYMHGMYNGMELMLAYAEGRKPVFRDKPEQWIKDIPVSESDKIPVKCEEV